MNEENEKKEIQVKNSTGITDPNGNIDKYWKKIGFKNGRPTPREIISYLEDKQNNRR